MRWSKLIGLFGELAITVLHCPCLLERVEPPEKQVQAGDKHQIERKTGSARPFRMVSADGVIKPRLGLGSGISPNACYFCDMAVAHAAGEDKHRHQHTAPYM